jgi:acetyl-CoA decarbonylase/synthase complex subunit delta
LAFEIPKQPYSGEIGTSSLGSGGSVVTLGGESAYAFHLFEGQMPNSPKIAMEIWDYDPSKEWPAAVVEPFKDVISSPDAWAKKCVEEFGADIIVVQLKGTDPNGMDRSAKESADLAKKVLNAVDVPVVFWGTANNQKDEEVLKAIAEVAEGKNVALGPVEEGNYKGVGASALGYGQIVVASSPIDVNLAKQLNILLGNLGVPLSKIVVDPTTGGLGYGMEYSYSVMERIRMAALTQEDDKLQVPMINNVGNEVWKCKEAGLGIDEAPTMGDPEKRGILMETVAAVCYLMAGSDVVILRHPESVRLVRSFVGLMTEGGMATDVGEIAKRLPEEKGDLASMAPEPNLDFGEPESAPKPKTPPKKKEEKAAPPPKKEEKVVEMKPKKEAPPKPAAEAKAKPEAEAKPKEETPEEAQKRAAEEARVAEEAKKKAEEEAKQKAEEEANRKAEEEARAAEEAKKRAEQEAEAAKAKQKSDLEALRKKRAASKPKVEKKAAKEPSPEKEAAKAKGGEAAKVLQGEDLVDRLTMTLKRMHKHS